MSIIYGRNQAPKHALPIEMNIKLIFILTISLIVKIVSYYVFPENIRVVDDWVHCVVDVIKVAYEFVLYQRGGY